MNTYSFIGVLVLLLTLFSCKDKTEADPEKNTQTEQTATSPEALRKDLFERIPGEESGVTFANMLKEDVSTMENLFNFDYFYNGSGVATGDFDNDGLQDLFFTGNQVSNALYHNQGDLKFKDISSSAGINQGKVWANGVTVADVNNDGFLDIYVCQGGPKQRGDRENLLYINQGDLTFVESAAEYGLNDTGISTQAVFFDYDKDGDLDCVVSNENEFYGLDPVSFYNQINASAENLQNSATHLYQNNNGKFTDVSKKAGVLIASFGLGVAVSDINDDGWLDIYIANDYYVPDAMYINNGNGTFSNQIKTHTKQVSFYGMGVDVADINNDGLRDIFVLDMASSDHVRSKTLMASMNLDRFSLLVDTYDMPYQYMYNSLQLNQGNSSFHNVSQQAKLSKTDWSWAGLMTDFDLDGHKDIYVTNGYRRYALDNDIQNQVREVQRAYRGNVPLKEKQRLYNALPSEKLSNIMFWNHGDLHFQNQAYQWGLADPSFSNGAIYVDLDNDGDLELVVNNIDEVAFLYKNTAVERKLNNFVKVVTHGKTSESFAKVMLTQNNGLAQFMEAKRVGGYLSANQSDLIFGIGKEETVANITVVWPSGKSQTKENITANSTVTFNESEATEAYKAKSVSPALELTSNNYGLDFTHKENEYTDFDLEVLLPYKQSTLGPFIAKADVNGDALEDIFIGGAAGQAGAIFVQTATGFNKLNSPALTADSASEDMEALFFDVDADGDQDLYVVSGGNEFPEFSAKYTDRLYLNDGQGGFTKAKQPGLATLTDSGKAVAAMDADNDGDLDLIIGNRIIPQHYPKAASSYFLENKDGQLVKNANWAPELTDFGIVNQVLATDFDKDGLMDFIALGEWTGVGMFKNNGNGFTNQAAKYGLDKQQGWWYSVTETDLNKDGAPDYILGNLGMNSKYKATDYSPFKVFASDFDDNGTFDIVLSGQYNGKDVPARGRECSSQQMPFILDKFKTYQAYANASLQDIYGEKLNTAYKKQVNQFHSLALQSDGQGGFTVIELPTLAQKAPIMSVVEADLNNDGANELITVGNIYNTEVETPRLDMGTGTVMSIGDNKLSTWRADKGIVIDGNAKDASLVMHKGLNKSLLLVARNNASLLVYQKTE